MRDRGGITGYEVCNFGKDAFERSKPQKYTDWLRDRNRWTGGNGLKKVTRLLKYLRDIKGTFTCPSVLLTTLLGERITSSDEFLNDPFADVPTALKTIAGRLDDWLQAPPTRPLVPNPVLPSEDFSHLWETDEKYENFRESINRYRGWIDEAYDEKDSNESVSKWRRVFGDAFAPGVVLDKSASVVEGARKLALAIVRASSNLVLDVRDDLVGLVSRFGPTVLPPEFTRLVYKQQPKWRRTPHGGFDVEAIATLHASKETGRIRNVVSGQGPLPKGHYLRFDVRQSGGTTFPTDKYRVHWRITNTDRDAVNAGCLRGGFEEADDGTARWEYLKFRGVHMAEAFVVRRKENMLVGQSAPLFVVIE